MPDKRELKFKVILLGESGVGKTSLIRRYVRGSFSESYIQTIGTTVSKRVDNLSLKSGRGVEVSLIVWDIMGNRRFIDLLGEAYFDNTQGALAVFDVTRRETFEALDAWIDAARKSQPRMPVVVLGNKSDLGDRRAVTDDGAKVHYEPGGLLYIPTSAKTGLNVEAAFRRLTLEILRTFPAAKPVPRR